MNDIYFTVETMRVMDGRTIKAKKPDSEGYYKDVPLMVLGVPTITGTEYVPESILNCMKDPKQYFTIALKSGNLYGEADHPETPTERDFPRLLTVKKQYVSHHFRSVSTSPINIEGKDCILISGDIKPTGPFGKYLEESLNNPNENTAFSVRSICSQRMVRGTKVREVKYLATFDSVSSGGFLQASKRYSPSNEELKLTPESFMEIPGLGTESCVITDRDFQSIFGSKHLEITRKLYSISGSYIPGYKCFRDKDGMKRSLFHHVFGSGQGE